MTPFILFSLLACPLVSAKSRSFNRTSVHHNSQPRITTNSSFVSAAWYAAWHEDDFPPAVVSWDKYTHLTYSFAVTTPDVNTLALVDGSNPEGLPVFVDTAHQNGVKALVSVGGWTGSLYYSTAIGSAKNRTAFVKTITSFATKYALDGIDFEQGIGCNAINPNDTSNFLAFLQEVRADPIGRNLILTAATSIAPWRGPDGNYLTDVTGFAKVLDWIAIMNYDVWGSWSSTVGPNAPLNDTCASVDNQQGSAVTGVALWTAAGMPVNQIVLGVASYGHSFHVDPHDAGNDRGIINAYPPFNASMQPSGDEWDDVPGTDVCGNETGPGGIFNFWGLVEQGFLTLWGTPAYHTTYRFDSCSQTAYVYHEKTSVMVSFDNARAFSAKGQFIRETKLRGFAMWEAGGDLDDILLDAILLDAGKGYVLT
ncbi:hypothetical protein GSI_01965 [Ganoderma sinense ZZ0214-1]|uniref:GH18 domain-containing protein n=1 Tax=Ganoderma sinense ZZ0214-1 TaxID=1077348 RepID=A0A2G8SRD1_9APHY|nr:hypothetical protein GSI_01965 [Ganoderma sinense ZZ0214-1]